MEALTSFRWSFLPSRNSGSQDACIVGWRHQRHSAFTSREHVSFIITGEDYKHHSIGERQNIPAPLLWSWRAAEPLLLNLRDDSRKRDIWTVELQLRTRTLRRKSGPSLFCPLVTCSQNRISPRKFQYFERSIYPLKSSFIISFTRFNTLYTLLHLHLFSTLCGSCLLQVQTSRPKQLLTPFTCPALLFT